jgi:hypothetical protein
MSQRLPAVARERANCLCDAFAALFTLDVGPDALIPGRSIGAAGRRQRLSIRWVAGAEAGEKENDRRRKHAEAATTASAAPGRTRHAKKGRGGRQVNS